MPSFVHVGREEGGERGGGGGGGGSSTTFFSHNPLKKMGIARFQ